MPMVQGSLLAGMQHLTATGNTVGVVVIDEQSADADTAPESAIETFAQQRVLLFASRMDYRIWLVELNPNPMNPNLPTRTRLRAVLPIDTPIVTKQQLNAFTGTNLHNLLQAAGIGAFVIMGYHVNCCVKQTAVGGHTGPRNTGPNNPGGTQSGYLVLTCPEILRGGAAVWWNEAGVRFYEYV